MPAILKTDAVHRLARAGRIEADPAAETQTKEEANAKAIAELRDEVIALQQAVNSLARDLKAQIAASTNEQISAMLRNATRVGERSADALAVLGTVMSKEPPPPPAPEAPVDPRGASWELRLPGSGFNAPDRVVTITRTV